MHLFFVDDLAISSKVDMKHSSLLKNMLGNFCEISGHKVNVRKTNVFFSLSVKENLRKEINSLLGFQVKYLRHYLGVLHVHKRVTKSTIYFFVERVQNHLSSRDAKKLCFAGRVTLAWTVLLSIPSYLMQLILVPMGVCDSIEEMARQFI